MDHLHLTDRAKGQWAEALAISWLVGEGYEVFTGFGNTSCDLVALRDGELLRVEVKYLGLRENKTSSFYYVPKADVDKFDLLVAVCSSGQVIADPPTRRIEAK